MADVDGTAEQLIVDELMDELVRTRQRIAELEVMEIELKQSEELFTTLFYSSPSGIYIVQGGYFRLVGHQFARIAGYNEDELIGVPSLSLVLTEDRDAARENAVQMLKGKRSLGYEFRLVTKRAEIKWVMGKVAPIFYQGGQANLGKLVAITARKQGEEEMKQVDTEMPRSNA